MQLSKLLSRTISILAFSVAGLLATSASAQSQNYLEVTPAQPSDTTGKIEVLEFFSYGCTHCNALEAPFEAWIKAQPDDVVVHQVPIAFNAGMQPMQQLYYTLEAMNRLDLHPAVFAAIHQQHKRLFTKDAIIDWAKEQGLDAKRFEATYDSFGVNSQVQRANTLTESYAIEGTPTLAVNGRYITSPSHTGGYSETVTEVDRLVKQIRAQQ